MQLHIQHELQSKSTELFFFLSSWEEVIFMLLHEERLRSAVVINGKSLSEASHRH